MPRKTGQYGYEIYTCAVCGNEYLSVDPESGEPVMECPRCYSEWSIDQHAPRRTDPAVKGAKWLCENGYLADDEAAKFSKMKDTGACYDEVFGE